MTRVITPTPMAAGGHRGARRSTLSAVNEPRPDPGVGPIAALLGIRRASMADGRSVFELGIRPEHMNPHGVVHGGVVYTLADCAMGGALTSVLEPTERCATLELKINYLAPALAGELRAEACVVARSGRASHDCITMPSRWRPP